MKKLLKCGYIAIGLTLFSCGTYFNQPVSIQKARTGELTGNSQIITSLPEPKELIVVGVYNFKDQTGQYKSVENGSTFSTAVPQGATTILIKALEDSKWFTPIERENLGNLLNERNIIRSTRDEYRKGNNANVPKLPPLLFAGILLEGGIVSYDTNMVTGGIGMRYFGAGGSSKYRQDRITVYLRAVSTSTGKILKTVYVSKTILSQSIDASLFRYVSFQRLLEAETGITRNEPVQLALKDAIEKSVKSLIIEGLEENLWSTKNGERQNDLLISEYKKEKIEEESKLLYNRKQNKFFYKNAFEIRGGSNVLNADYSNKEFGFNGSLAYHRYFSPHISASLSMGYFKFKGQQELSKEYFSYDLNLQYDILPRDNFSPFLYGGVGYLDDLHNEFIGATERTSALKVQFGGGVNIELSRKVSLRLYGENNLSFSDTIDDFKNGTRDDYYYNFGLGLFLNIGNYKINKN
jgi:curli production assembly/transport component CsgG